MITQVLTASVGVFFNLLLSTFIVDNLYLLLLLRNIHIHHKTTYEGTISMCYDAELLEHVIQKIFKIFEKILQIK